MHNIHTPLAAHLPRSCRNSLVLTGSWPAIILVGLAAIGDPVAKPEMKRICDPVAKPDIRWKCDRVAKPEIRWICNPVAKPEIR